MPFQDHPSHLLRENVLLNYNNPKYDYNRNFDINFNPVPNILSDLVVYLFGLVFPLKIASRIFYSLYIILFPASYYVFLTATGRKRGVYVLFAVLYTYSFFAVMGNENFLLSLVLFFSLWGIILSFNRSFAREIIIFIVVQFLYLSHMFTFYIGFISISAFFLFERKMKEMILKILYFMPGVIMFFLWQVSESGTLTVKKNIFLMILLSRNKIKTLLASLSPYLYYSGYTFAGLIFLAVVILAIYGVKTRSGAKFTKLGYVFYLIIAHIFLPTTLFFYGPDQRAFFIAVLFAVSLFPLKYKIRYCVVLILIILNLYSAIANYDYFKISNAQIKQIVKEFRKIPKGLNILPVVFEPYLWSCAGHRVFEYYHLSKGGVNPYHFFTGNNIVRYKTDPVRLDIYKNNTDRFTPELINRFDAVLIIGSRFNPQVAGCVYFFSKTRFNNVIVRSSDVYVLGKGK